MYTGINNFFLKNYTAAATTFITADEYTNKGSDYYLYNKLHLYAVIARLNWPEARAFLKRVEESVTDEKMRESWAFSIIHAINTMDFTTLMNKVDTLDDTENKSVRAENLCEAYYYVGMDLYNRGQKELAKIFFVMSKAQHVPYFMEYTMSDLALKRYYSGDSDRTDETATADQDAGEAGDGQEGTVPAESSDGQPAGEKTDIKNSNED
jgi:lipoprotein NlpI